jgi:hypothetical protein
MRFSIESVREIPLSSAGKQLVVVNNMEQTDSVR